MSLKLSRDRLVTVSLLYIIYIFVRLVILDKTRILFHFFILHFAE